MFDNSTLAYSLSQADSGWTWSVYDIEGEMVAHGADASRDAAQAAVERLLHSACAQAAA